TTQQNWIDAMDASLYKDHRPAGEVSAWVQPTGGHDAYNTGEKVSHLGKIYNSEIDANTQVPGSDERWWTEVV
ncbi:MAG: hypothetical protein LC687_00910, partial [Actinobacteria bacterium]|nr:hypothetical protein [Actinomycetota bacterium]